MAERILKIGVPTSVFREVEDGRGSMDTVEDVYTIDMEFPRDN